MLQELLSICKMLRKTGYTSIGVMLSHLDLDGDCKIPLP
uniref:Uncharacterized protein n=1 Tax=Anguilla anguilla TaxID=7936 RepID=A0A0E9U290_ANGAN